jgi:hypothetical protein
VERLLEVLLGKGSPPPSPPLHTAKVGTLPYGRCPRAQVFVVLHGRAYI